MWRTPSAWPLHSRTTAPKSQPTFQVKSEDLQIYCLKNIFVAKISLPRVPIEGSRNERDMHGGQQYVSLLDIPC